MVTVTVRWSPQQRRERLLAEIERRDRDFGALHIRRWWYSMGPPGSPVPPNSSSPPMAEGPTVTG